MKKIKDKIYGVEVPIDSDKFRIKNGAYVKWLRSETHGELKIVPNIPLSIVGTVSQGIFDFKKGNEQLEVEISYNNLLQQSGLDLTNKIVVLKVK